MLGLLLVGAVPKAPLVQLDSQVVLERYFAELNIVEQPKAVIFQYSISQSGPNNIEQTHRVYRSGATQRDETLAVDGVALKPPSIRISKYHDRYTIQTLAPRPGLYTFLFLRAHRVANHLEYTYSALPLAPLGGFAVTSFTIDGSSYLPSALGFRSVNGATSGAGTVAYAKAGHYWMPLLATVTARIAGKPARERIAWSQYRFPSAMPQSTFH
ncbi:MAG: hypothetical protein ABI182_07755 [Candidatus Baltobacteraceae bacterium]